MSKFIVSGYYKDLKCHLTLPKSKHYFFNAIENGEQELQVDKVIMQAVYSKKYDDTHNNPCSVKNHKIQELPRTLQHILTKHPFPLAQGPVVLPIDCIIEGVKTVDEVLRAKTIFTHDDDQDCFAWLPSEGVGVASWGQQDQQHETYYKVEEPTFTIQGPTSTTRMGLVYTCQKLKCLIHCLCKICTDTSENCRLQCRAEVCQACNSQCTRHEIKVQRLFKSEENHFTLVTQMMNKYQFAYPYAGVPLSCVQCSLDVLEHQVLHLVYHKLCRYCRFEMRPFEHKSIVSGEEYMKADQVVQAADRRTCAVCLVKCQDKYARKMHEKSVHEGCEKQYKCDNCNKSYGNTNALEYHTQSHHDVTKSTCDLCSFQCSSKGILLRHIGVVHGEETGSEHKCSKCQVSFSREDNLERHKREKHFFATKGINLDYVEDLDNLGVIECSKCDRTFKRRCDLKRHIGTAHRNSKLQNTFTCATCDVTFSRKDALVRHTKKKH